MKKKERTFAAEDAKVDMIFAYKGAMALIDLMGSAHIDERGIEVGYQELCTVVLSHMYDTLERYEELTREE